MPPDGTMSIGERFVEHDKRIRSNERHIVDLRIDIAKQQIKLAVIVGITNFLAFGLVEVLLVWFKH